MFTQTLQNAGLFIVGCLLFEKAALFHAGEHFKLFLYASLLNHLAIRVPICALDNIDAFWEDSIVWHEFPKQLTVYAVKGLFKVNETDINSCVPFCRLLSDERNLVIA